ncbi:NAD-dependent epimerase/dehydratase family protein [Stenotrophomonas sp. MMGLT7]|uniref:NAD-dependent epimerase/dehydratase family protein n=1 Tax=Stenotrophomonas sp. MMGLT7 TaxID=2901227 RepID=UPI001E5B3745|nr:NAD-dependent epimerase/dehydratase family protein [Stenotrophomonas sp. MMGLT7]MCD7099168.1 NAD-dependent epimerase/dehydratase family protein [Stenotrophomonas sp. MMGLT7]
MIIGSGLVARAFAPRYEEDRTTVIFASGVSNSNETNPAAFARERAMLVEQLERSHCRLVYFGSCNVVNTLEHSSYFQHKRAMEALVVDSGHGTVLRLPQVVGHTRNPNTLTNFIRDCILQERQLTLWAGAQRNLIDIDDVAAIATHILDSRTVPPIVTIASPWSLPMPRIVDLFEQVLGRRAHRVLVDRGEAMAIDSARSEQIARDIGIDFGPSYPLRVLQKYYAPRHEA